MNNMKIKAILPILILILLVSNISAGKVTYDFNICGGSMKPVMNSDKYCNLYKVNTVTSNDIVNLNDIVCFNYNKMILKSNARYVCHRIVEIDNNNVCTKGDNNNVKDYCFDKKYIALKVLI